jgi:hypothetical protein
LTEYNQRKYYFEDNFYASIDECAAAIALQRYLPGFKIEKDKTFQVRGGTQKSFDFVLPDSIVEWHPINIEHDSKNLGRRGCLEALHKIRDTLKPGERETYLEILSEFKRDLTKSYQNERQDASDKSLVLKGKEVILVRNIYEFYDLVISKYGDKSKIPQRTEFAKQFKEFRKLAQPIIRKKKKSKQDSGKLEQKVEVAGAAGA